MKKYLFLLLFPLALFGLYQGNPASPQIIEEGFFISQDSFLTAKIGYQADWVWDRKMKVIGASSGRVDQFNILLNQGVFTIDVLDRLELYASLGSFTTEFSHRPKSINGARIEYQTHDRLTVGGGLRLILMQWGNTTLGADGTAQYSSPRTKWETLNGVSYSQNCRLSYTDWQASLAVSHAIDIFTPYLGASYSSVHAQLSRIPRAILPSSHIKLRNRDRFGLVLGCTLSSCKKFDLTLETRMISEQALTGAGNIKF